MPMREDMQAYRITGENDVGKTQPGVQQLQADAGRTTPQSTVQTTTVAASQTSSASTATASTPKTTPTTTSPSDEIAKLKAQLAALETPKQEVIPPKAMAAPPSDVVGLGTSQEPIDAGFGDMSPAPAPVAVVHANTVEDTGPAEDCDDDLNDRVAGLLQR